MRKGVFTGFPLCTVRTVDRFGVWLYTLATPEGGSWLAAASRRQPASAGGVCLCLVGANHVEYPLVPSTVVIGVHLCEET